MAQDAVHTNLSPGKKGARSGQNSLSKQTATSEGNHGISKDFTDVIPEQEGGISTETIDQDQATDTVRVNGTDLRLVIRQGDTSLVAKFASNHQTVSVRVSENEVTAVVFRERDRSTISGADDAPKDHETASVRVVVNRDASRTVTLQRDPPILDTDVSPNEQAAPVREKEGGTSDETVTKDQTSDDTVREVVVRQPVPANLGTSSGSNSAFVAIPIAAASLSPPALPKCGICKKREGQITNPSKTPCGHLFCFPCMREWIDTSPSAVRCRSCSKPIDHFLHTGQRPYTIYPRGSDGKRRRPSVPGQKPRRVRDRRPRRRHHNGGGGAQPQ